MPRTSRRRTTRARRAVRWTGFNAFDFTQDNTISSTVIYDPAVELARSAPGSKGVLMAVRGHLAVTANAGTAATTFRAYIAAFGTDETKTVPTGAPWNINAQDIDIAQKRMLWLESRFLLPFDSVERNVVEIEISVKVKIRIYPQMAIFLVTQGQNTNTCNVMGHCRTLITA